MFFANRKFKYIKLGKLINKNTNKYYVIEFSNSDYNRTNHFPNAYVLDINDIENELTKLDKNRIFVLNNELQLCKSYFSLFKANNIKKLYILI